MAVLHLPTRRKQRVTCRVTDYLDENDEVRILRRAGQRMRVTQGTAWVSMDSEDLLVYAGEVITLTSGSLDAAVSNVGDEPLVYELTWACGA